MKRFLEFPAVLVLGILSLSATQEASAACMYETGPGQVNGANPLYPARFGSWVNIYAKTSGDAGINCDTYRTDIDGYPTNRLTEVAVQRASTQSIDEKVYNAGKANEYTLDMQADSSATASIANGTVTATVRTYNATAYVDSDAEWIDLVKIENLTAGPTDVNYIPVTYCSEITSEFTTNGPDFAGLYYADYNVGSESRIHDSLTINGGNSIVHATNGQICRTGEIKMTGQYVHFSLKLKAYALGNPGYYEVPTFNGYTTNVRVKDASVTASFEMGALPSGAVCYSASGTFPGCEPCRDETGGYSSLDETAWAAFLQTNNETDTDAFEYGGEIYRVCSSPGSDPLMKYTYRKLGPTGGNINPLPPTIAGWHTHDQSWDPAKWLFSFGVLGTGDLEWVMDNQLPLYLGLPALQTVSVLPPSSTSIFQAHDVPQP